MDQDADLAVELLAPPSGRAGGPSTQPGSPRDVVTAAEEAAAAGMLTADDVKEGFRSIDRLVEAAGAADCRSAGQRLLAAARTAGLVGRGVLLTAANLHAGLGDAELAAGLVVEAHAFDPAGFTESHPRAAWRQIRRHGPGSARTFVHALQDAGVPVPHEMDPDSFLTGMQRARSSGELSSAIDELEEAGGFPDVVAAGRAFTVLRTARGRTAGHVLRLLDVATTSSTVTPRLVNDALIVLAELGAAEESRLVLAGAEAAGLTPTADHRLSLVTALANALRFDEALEAYERYLDDGLPASARARRVHVQALALSDRTAELAAALLDWASAIRAGTVTDPPANGLSTALSALVRDDITVVIDVVEGSAGAFTYNGTHRKLISGNAERTRSVLTFGQALAALAAAGLPPTSVELGKLSALAAGAADEDVVAAFGQVARTSADALARLAPELALAQIATGDLAAAEATAVASLDPIVIEAVVAAHLDTGDIGGALRVCELYEPEPPETARPRPPMPYPPALVTRVVRALATRRGTEHAEEWLRRYAQAGWPMEAWEALAWAYRRDKGNSAAIERLMARMRRVGNRPSGDVWAHWLYALPRHKRASRVAQAQEAMRVDEAAVTPSFFTAAIVGALQPEKVSADSVGSDAEAAAWRNAQRAMAAGEQMLITAVTSLTGRQEAKRSPGSWFTPGQLLEIARAYPLARRPYAQVDTAVEVRVASETEPEEQFTAFLGALAAAHARALLPEGVRRLRTAADQLGLGGRPELVAASFDALAGEPGAVPEAVAVELSRGALAAPMVAEAAGRALATAGSTAAVLQALEGTETAQLDDDTAEVLLSAAVLALAEAAQPDPAQELGRVAETRGLALSPAALGALLTSQRPEGPEAAEHGPVWTTSQLAAYNSLLEHEFANHLRASGESVELLGDVVASLRSRLPREAVALITREFDALDGVLGALRRTRALQRRSLEKIAAAADLERVSAGVVPVLSTIEAVVEQLRDEAAAANSTLRVLDSEAFEGMAVRGHATLLQFALHNLMTNALKAHTRRRDSEHRYVDLLATFAESDREDLADAPYGWVVLSVRDHGDGVPENLPGNVANWSIPGQPGQGAGIGLRVTENMLRQSGGQLWIDTSVAEGSRFCFRLPSAARRDARATRQHTRDGEAHV
jgi:signal transduction histidine kinase